MSVDGNSVLNSTVGKLMAVWEETTYHLELRQTNSECAKQEYFDFYNRTSPAFKLTCNPEENILPKNYLRS